jgi:hypothetical protein
VADFQFEVLARTALGDSQAAVVGRTSCFAPTKITLVKTATRIAPAIRHVAHSAMSLASIARLGDSLLSVLKFYAPLRLIDFLVMA